MNITPFSISKASDQPVVSSSIHSIHSRPIKFLGCTTNGSNSGTNSLAELTDKLLIFGPLAAEQRQKCLALFFYKKVLFCYMYCFVISKTTIKSMPWYTISYIYKCVSKCFIHS